MGFGNIDSGQTQPIIHDIVLKVDRIGCVCQYEQGSYNGPRRDDFSEMIIGKLFECVGQSCFRGVSASCQ